jgi:hypothetical protein
LQAVGSDPPTGSNTRADPYDHAADLLEANLDLSFFDSDP